MRPASPRLCAAKWETGCAHRVGVCQHECSYQSTGSFDKYTSYPQAFGEYFVEILHDEIDPFQKKS